ncbi:esterase/lipase family protein [Litoribrevibacter albus]|nr:hypothetical protein [Litoribrevibacter albus]
MTDTFSVIQGILNGAIGDTLAQTQNELAIQMDFYHHNQPLELALPLDSQLPHLLSNKLIVLIHGLTNTESIWNFKAATQENKLDNYGLRLQQEFKYTPFYLRYNTGLDIHENGKAFSNKMSQLLDQYPIEVDEIVLVGYSMGGLVARCAQIDSENLWTHKVSQCIYIGTPHEGAPLERLGHLTGKLFGQIPKSYFNIWEEWINLRSTGIKSLHSGLSKQEINFHDQVQHCFISGGVFNSNKQLRDLHVGDSLVQRKSAQPANAPQTSLTAHFEKIDHFNLPRSENVFITLRKWFEKFSTETKVITYSPAIDQPFTSTGKQVRSFLNEDVLRGSSKLALDLFQKTVHTADLMHHEISQEPYSVLTKIPVVGNIADSIKTAHFTISKGVFAQLRKAETLLRACD